MNLENFVRDGKGKEEYSEEEGLLGSESKWVMKKI